VNATTTNARSAIVGGCAVAALVAAYGLGTWHGGGGDRANAATPPTTTGGITVSGAGKVEGQPDVLRLGLTINDTRSTVNEAMSAAAHDVRALLHALGGAGVTRRDMQTSGLSIDPSYDYANGHEYLKGYDVSESVTVKIRKLDTAGRTISAAAHAAGNSIRIDDISFNLDDNKALLGKARTAAFNDAKSKAEQYAAADGAKLGVVRSITERVTGVPEPIPYRAAFDSLQASAGATLPIVKGTQNVTVSVKVVWAIS
jgi:uncharacterized protein